MREEILKKSLNIVEELILIKRASLIVGNDYSKETRMHVRNVWEELKDLLGMIILPCFDKDILEKYTEIVSTMESNTKQKLLDEIEFMKKKKKL